MSEMSSFYARIIAIKVSFTDLRVLGAGASGKAIANVHETES